MQPWLASIAAPLAATAVRSAGQVAATAAEPFAAALDRALGGGEPSCDDCRESEASSLQERVQQQLANLLEPYGAGADSLALQVDPDTGAVEVTGDSPAAAGLRNALAQDGQLRGDLVQLAAQLRDANAGQFGLPQWPDFFSQPAGGVPLRWDGAQLTAT